MTARVQGPPRNGIQPRSREFLLAVVCFALMFVYTFAAIGLVNLLVQLIGGWLS